jgi:PPOX class probable FMN-dependent enzyme
MTDRRSWTLVSDERQLGAIVGEPLPRVAAKARRTLHHLDREWLTASPLCFVATAGRDGTCDVSPKGDPAGLARVLDDQTLALPERPGNRRADGFHNVLSNPQVGLIFVIPGRSDSLRINGTAEVVSDAPFFAEMTVHGHRPRLALVVSVREVFYHCGKAFLRSDVWEPGSWNPDAVPSRAHIAASIERPGESLEDLIRYYGPQYSTRLYQP